MVDVAIQLGEIEEAKKWVDLAEQENILPAKAAYLKGLLLTEEGKNGEAAKSFEKAKSIDPKVSQAADIQIALSYLRERQLKKAKESFESAITYDPQSDLAGFARQYLAMVEKRLETERPFRFLVGFYGQYDDNMVLKPSDEALAVGITNEESRVFNSLFRATYSPVLKGPWLFNAQYAFSSSLHDKNVHTHDSFSNTFSVTPGYNFGRYAFNLSTTYTHSLVRDPSYKRYSGYFSSGPMLRWAVKANQLLEFFAGYTNNELFQPALSDDEDRDSEGYSAYASWVWLFKKKAFLNLRYRFEDNNTDGANWDNIRNTVSANLVYPLRDSLKLQVSGQVAQQDFDNVHSRFGVKRDDTTITFSTGLSWDFYKNTTLVAQYTRIQADSNVGIYDYTRDLYTMGMEYRF